MFLTAERETVLIVLYYCTVPVGSSACVLFIVAPGVRKRLHVDVVATVAFDFIVAMMVMVVIVILLRFLSFFVAVVATIFSVRVQRLIQRASGTQKALDIDRVVDPHIRDDDFALVGHVAGAARFDKISGPNELFRFFRRQTKAYSSSTHEGSNNNTVQTSNEQSK